jgi:hypothetical protein
LSVRVDFTHGGAVGEIENVNHLVTTTKSDETAVDDFRGCR